jgi:hypothetical protein
MCGIVSAKWFFMAITHYPFTGKLTQETLKTLKAQQADLDFCET